MRTGPLFVLAGLMLAACEPSVPNSGVGFGNYEDYLRTREAELQGQKAPAQAAPVMTEPLNGGGYGTSGYGATPVTSPAGIAAQQAAADGSATPPAQGTIGADTLAALKATAPAGDTGPAETSASGAPAASGDAGAPLNAMAPGTPMSPAATAAATKGAAGPNLAAYALGATNQPGQKLYDRGVHLTTSKAACARYVSPDLAQMAFLKRGGPVRDPLNLDPDGDGFACGWDPRPFQMARP